MLLKDAKCLKNKTGKEYKDYIDNDLVLINTNKINGEHHRLLRSLQGISERINIMFSDKKDTPVTVNLM